MLLIIWLRVLRGHFKPDRHFAFEAVAWYWHFVDVVWLACFSSSLDLTPKLVRLEDAQIPSRTSEQKNRTDRPRGSSALAATSPVIAAAE